jgi:hypothetical protein
MQPGPADASLQPDSNSNVGPELLLQPLLFFGYS